MISTGWLLGLAILGVLAWFVAASNRRRGRQDSMKKMQHENSRLRHMVAEHMLSKDRNDR